MVENTSRVIYSTVSGLGERIKRIARIRLIRSPNPLTVPRVAVAQRIGYTTFLGLTQARGLEGRRPSKNLFSARGGRLRRPPRAERNICGEGTTFPTPLCASPISKRYCYARSHPYLSCQSRGLRGAPEECAALARCVHLEGRVRQDFVCRQEQGAARSYALIPRIAARPEFQDASHGRADRRFRDHSDLLGAGGAAARDEPDQAASPEI